MKITWNTSDEPDVWGDIITTEELAKHLDDILNHDWGVTEIILRCFDGSTLTFKLELEDGS